MANRVDDMGMDVQVTRRLSGKYDSCVEKEVVDWINKLTGSNIHCGRENVALCLRNGQMLINVINAVYEGTTALPAAAAGLRFPFKKNTSKIAFKEGIIGLQAGYNKGANQSGLSFGASRHVADLKVDEMSAGGKSLIGLQAGSNLGASQSGMSMGAQRHIADIKVDQMSGSGQTVIGLQAGSNQGASQSGMSMGSVRHIGDIQSGELSRSGQGVIGLQAGSNKGASQTGMAFGTQRHINDLNVGGRK